MISFGPLFCMVGADLLEFSSWPYWVSEKKNEKYNLCKIIVIGSEIYQICETVDMQAIINRNSKLNFRENCNKILLW